MTPGFAVFIMMNNYFHDVATAMLVACSLTLWLLTRRFEANRDPDSLRLLLRLHKGLSEIAAASVVWIVTGGMVRFLTFSSFEWPNAVARHHTHGLMIKYSIASCMIAGGAYLWVMVNRKIKRLPGERDSGVHSAPAEQRPDL